MLLALFACLMPFGAIGLSAALALADGLLMLVQYAFMQRQISRMEGLKVTK